MKTKMKNENEAISDIDITSYLYKICDNCNRKQFCKSAKLSKKCNGFLELEKLLDSYILMESRVGQYIDICNSLSERLDSIIKEERDKKSGE